MSIEAMKQALEALEKWAGGADEPAITALRQAIAEAERKSQEFPKHFDTHQSKREAEKQEPVAWIKRTAKGNIFDLLCEPDKGAEPVYTHPQPKAEQSPLSKEEIEDEWEHITGHSIVGGNPSDGRQMYVSHDEICEFAYAIERAHGIGDKA